jgi:ribosomal-protein-alanine N-acetyltransferase
MPSNAAFPTLTTEHLRLRALQATDAPSIFPIKGDPQVTTPYAQEPHASLADSAAWISRIQETYNAREGIVWGITQHGNDSVIGTCLFWNFTTDRRCVELGYELLRAAWGQGVAREAVTAVMAYGFHTLHLHRVEAVVMSGNPASTHLLQHLGFTHEGTLRQREWFQEQPLDHLYYGLLAQEWGVPIEMNRFSEFGI